MTTENCIKNDKKYRVILNRFLYILWFDGKNKQINNFYFTYYQ